MIRTWNSSLKNAFTGGLDVLHYWHEKEYYIDARLIGSNINGSTEAITALQESSVRYYQRPDAGYLNYDTTLTQLRGFGGKFKIGRLHKEHWKYSTSLTLLSPGLELNDLGYMTFADEIKNDNIITYQITKPVSVFTLTASILTSSIHGTLMEHTWVPEERSFSTQNLRTTGFSAMISFILLVQLTPGFSGVALR